MLRAVTIGFIIVAIVAGGLWLAWGNPGRHSDNRKPEHRAVMAAMRRFGEVKERVVPMEIREAGAAILSAAQDLYAVDLTRTDEGSADRFSDTEVAEFGRLEG